MAANRIIVQRAVGDAFVERLCAQAATLRTGDPAMNDLYHPVVQNGRLSRRLKESLLVAASEARECRYCAGGHSLFLVSEFGYDQDAVRLMRSGGQHDGWTDAEIVEALIMASHSAWTTTVAQALHLEDDLAAPEFAGYF